jgi:glycine/D-amino acid oxidase-like deaminating enzyme
MKDMLPASARVVIVGAGFAGAATAWALGRLGVAGVMLEQEIGYGMHASGRNAALLRLAEADPIILPLALLSADRIRRFSREAESPLFEETGGLTLADAVSVAKLKHEHRALRDAGLMTFLLSAHEARERMPLLSRIDFEAALWCSSEGVVDIHALLTRFVQDARASGFRLFTECTAEDLLIEAGRVTGVRTSRGEIRADLVVDASGAWAGRLGRTSAPLPLRPLRRHLFVSGAPDGDVADLPFAWHDDAAFYFRPEGDGLLFSPCDETQVPPGEATTDPAAAELLAEKLSRHAPGFADLPLKRSWACLRTFAPDRKPVIGPDPDLPGLFHVSGLGGFGMTTSAAVGELAAALITGNRADWIDLSMVLPKRLAD